MAGDHSSKGEKFFLILQCNNQCSQCSQCSSLHSQYCKLENNTKTKATSLKKSCKNFSSQVAVWSATRARLEGKKNDDPARRAVQCPAIAEVINLYERDAAGVRAALRELPEVRASYVAEVFALVIFHADGFMKLRPGGSVGSQTAMVVEGAMRFFEMAAVLPIELQMVMCNRLFASPKDSVLTKHSELAFRGLIAATTGSTIE